MKWGLLGVNRVGRGHEAPPPRDGSTSPARSRRARPPVLGVSVTHEGQPEAPRAAQGRCWEGEGSWGWGSQDGSGRSGRPAGRLCPELSEPQVRLPAVSGPPLPLWRWHARRCGPGGSRPAPSARDLRVRVPHRVWSARLSRLHKAESTQLSTLLPVQRISLARARGSGAAPSRSRIRGCSRLTLFSANWDVRADECTRPASSASECAVSWTGCHFKSSFCRRAPGWFRVC